MEYIIEVLIFIWGAVIAPSLLVVLVAVIISKYF